MHVWQRGGLKRKAVSHFGGTPQARAPAPQQQQQHAQAPPQRQQQPVAQPAAQPQFQVRFQGNCQIISELRYPNFTISGEFLSQNARIPSPYCDAGLKMTF